MISITPLIGNVTRDPETKQAGDKTVLEFGLAVNTGYKGRDDSEEPPTAFYDVTVWDEGLQQSVKRDVYKGSKVGVIGSTSEREYKGKTYLKINGSEIFLCQKLLKAQAAAPAAAAGEDLGF